MITSHSLSQVTGIRSYDKDKSKLCFEIEDISKKTILCVLPDQKKKKNIQNIVKEWMNDILDFIKNCGNHYNNQVILKYKKI
jgi:hypothetical protein